MKKAISKSNQNITINTKNKKFFHFQDDNQMDLACIKKGAFEGNANGVMTKFIVAIVFIL